MNRFLRYLVILGVLLVAIIMRNQILVSPADEGCGNCSNGDGTWGDGTSGGGSNNDDGDCTNCNTDSDGDGIPNGTYITYQTAGGFTVCYIESVGPCGGGGGGDGGATPIACSATAPSGLSAVRLNATSAALTWTPGSNGVQQSVFVGSNLSAVQQGCSNGTGSGSGCVVSTHVGANVANYNTGSILSPGTIYYWKVVTNKSDTCNATSPVQTYLSSCYLSTPTLTLARGSTRPLFVSVTSSSSISSVAYSIDSDPANIVSFSPNPVNAYPFTTNVTADVLGSGIISADVYSNTNAILCSDVAGVLVIPPYPWWQVIDSDVQTTGNLRSSVQAGRFFGEPGLGGFPGVPAAMLSLNFGEGEASGTFNWQVWSTLINLKPYYYSDLVNLIPSNTVITPLETSSIVADTFANAGNFVDQGYSWYKYDGAIPLSIDQPINIGNNRIVLLVEGTNLDINSTVNLTKGSGFFMAIVNGHINVDAAVTGGAGPALEGIYVADGVFTDESKITTESPEVDSPFKVRGTVVAYQGFQLQRDMVDGNDDPVEIFEYAPDQIMLYPSVLGRRRIKWEEVAP